MVRQHRDVLIILGCVLLTTLPFSSKAFHIDDVAWIAVAKAILLNPSQPFHGQASLVAGDPPVFEKLGRSPRAFERLSHPAIFPYFVALVIYLASGITERSLHISYLFFVLTAAIAAYLLGKRFTNHPLFTALFVIASPMFILSSHSLMNDMAMLAFYLSAIVAYVRGVDRNDRTALILSGIFLALAILTRYVAFTLIPLLAAYSLLKKRTLSMAALLPFAIGLLIYGLWEIRNVIQYGAPHLLASSKFATTFYEGANVGFRTTLENALSDPVYVGGTTVIPLALLFAFLTTRRRIVVFALAYIVFLSALIQWAQKISLFDSYSNVELSVFLFFFLTGLLVIYHILDAGLKGLIRFFHTKSLMDQNTDTIFLSLWFGGMLFSAICVLPFGAARYMLPLLLPMIMLFVNQIEDLFAERKQALKLFCISSIMLTLVISVAMAYADYIYAGIYRSFAASVRGKYKTATNQLWFVADWGFRFYMERENYEYLWLSGSAPREGDVIIKPREAAVHDLSDAIKSRVKFLEKVTSISTFSGRMFR
jgi:4-amino-4-deoxy-L-arabinose transferase-like glycosyltransferase